MWQQTTEGRHKINTQKSVVFMYISNRQSEKEIRVFIEKQNWQE